MARIFNELLYEGQVTTNTEIFSDAAFNEVLGRADELRFQIVIEDSTGASPVNVTSTYYTSMNNSNWLQNAQRLTGATNLPFVDGFNNITSFPNSGYGRIGISVEAGKKAYVKFYATGRAK